VARQPEFDLWSLKIAPVTSELLESVSWEVCALATRPTFGLGIVLQAIQMKERENEMLFLTSFFCVIQELLITILNLRHTWFSK
jgi:hypothetical protein